MTVRTNVAGDGAGPLADEAWEDDCGCDADDFGDREVAGEEGRVMRQGPANVDEKFCDMRCKGNRVSQALALQDYVMRLRQLREFYLKQHA